MNINNGTENKTSENKRIESFEGKTLHPSLDIREDTLILGFRYRATLKDEKEICWRLKEKRFPKYDYC